MSGGAAFAAYMAAVNDGLRPHPVDAVRNGIRHSLLRLQGLGHSKLPSSVSVAGDSLDGSRRGLKSAELALVTQYMLSPDTGHKLRKLNLSHTPLSEEVVSQLCEALKILPELTVLRVRDCALRDVDAAAICDALHPPGVTRRRALVELAIASNDLGVESGKAIAAAVRELPALCHLDVSFNKLTGSSGQQIARAIALSRSIETLGFAFCELARR